MRDINNVFPFDFGADPAGILMVAESVPLSTHLDYLHHAHDHDERDYSEKELVAMGTLLLEKEVSDIQKKRMMGVLAHQGSPTAYRILENYYLSAVGDMKEWTALALTECRLFLESSFEEMPSPEVKETNSDLSGKLRCWFLFLPEEGATFSNEDAIELNDEAQYIAARRACLVEQTNSDAGFYAITILCPRDMVPAEFAKDLTEQGLVLGIKIQRNFYITTSRVPDADEIPEIIGNMYPHGAQSDQLCR